VGSQSPIAKSAGLRSALIVCLRRVRLGRRLPHVAALSGVIGGLFDVGVLERSSALLADVVGPVLTGSLGQILGLH
jgi:hypothetical protein